MLGKVAAAGAIIWFVNLHNILFLLKDTLIIILFTDVSSISINIVLFCTSPAFVLFFLTAFHNCNFGDFGNAFLS